MRHAKRGRGRIGVALAVLASCCCLSPMLLWVVDNGRAYADGFCAAVPREGELFDEQRFRADAMRLHFHVHVSRLNGHDSFGAWIEGAPFTTHHCDVEVENGRVVSRRASTWQH